MHQEEFLAHQLVYRELRKVKGYDVASDGFMSVPKMIEALHEASIQQVVELGLSVLELSEVDLTWVLVQQHLRIVNRPRLGDQLIIITYPSGKDRLYTYRDFLMLDSNEEVLATASSTWILMDTKNRKLGKYPPAISDLLLQSNEFEALPRSSLLKATTFDVEPDASYQVRYHDLDFNGHLSNTFFFKWMLDSISFDFQNSKTLSELNVRFKEEAHWGDVINTRIHEKGKSCSHELEKRGQVIAFGQSHWS